MYPCPNPSQQYKQWMHAPKCEKTASSPFLFQFDTFGKWLRCLTNVCYVNIKKNSDIWTNSDNLSRLGPLITSLIRKQCPFYSRLTWRVCGQCLLIEGEPWRLNWVSPTLRHLLQLDKVSSMSMPYDYDYDLYFDHNPLVLTILLLRREEQEQLQHFCWNS